MDFGTLKIIGGELKYCAHRRSAPLFGKEPKSLRVLNRVGKWLISQWPEAESNRRHKDFQSSALPTELSGHLN